jgi:hypothetical protein
VTTLRNRQALTQTDKQKNFSRAFEVITIHRGHGDFLAAYVVSFSVFEDRVMAAMMWAKDLAGRPRPTKHLRLYERIDVLVDGKHIDAATATDWRAAGNERNALIHAAMWEVDTFSEQHVESAYRRARKADALARKLCRLVAKSG